MRDRRSSTSIINIGSSLETFCSCLEGCELLLAHTETALETLCAACSSVEVALERGNLGIERINGRVARNLARETRRGLLVARGCALLCELLLKRVQCGCRGLHARISGSARISSGCEVRVLAARELGHVRCAALKLVELGTQHRLLPRKLVCARARLHRCHKVCIAPRHTRHHRTLQHKPLLHNCFFIYRIYHSFLFCHHTRRSITPDGLVPFFSLCFS